MPPLPLRSSSARRPERRRPCLLCGSATAIPPLLDDRRPCLLCSTTGGPPSSARRLAVPYLYFNITLYLQRKHLVDVTEIYNQLSREKTKKPEAFQAGYLVILLVLSLFWLLWTIAGEEFD
ncbi:unnamed protein product [Linum tenue]|uniref:Uncharacterized protein n=1 Tax=Linum tenue TaxID=586396 RepID=A0AAV0PLT2_9ROSI|nr:unnamed protein product [Linum tenue]